MATPAQQQIPGGPFVNESTNSAASQRQIPGGPVWNAPSTVTSSVPTLSLSTYKPGTLTSVGFQPRVTAS